MKDRGIGTAVVIAIVIIITAVGASGTLLLMRGGGGTGLPVYSGAHKVGQRLDDNLAGELYSFTESGEAVYNWYKSQMPAEGWTLYSDLGYTAGYGCVLYYTKGDDLGAIAIIESASDIAVLEAQTGLDVPGGAKVVLLGRGPASDYI